MNPFVEDLIKSKNEQIERLKRKADIWKLVAFLVNLIWALVVTILAYFCF
jgi:molybdopterin synthase catalytic subunit